MTWLSDATLERLREAADWPDLTGTRYELMGVLGRGGMSTVFRARDRELDREVALKVMTAGPAGDGTVARLRNEARVLARLEHPGLVPVHDVGTLPDGRLFYVMRLVRGRRLDEHARQERVAPRAAAAVRARLRGGRLRPRAGRAAPRPQAGERDGGPLRRGARARLGLAKRVDGPAAASAPVERGPLAPPVPAPVALADAPTRTQRGTVLGTPGYMAPEQARGEVDRLDQRADVFALGAMLRFLLQARGEAPPRALQAIVEKASAADPAGRYPAVSALAADVSRFLSAESVEAHREGPAERLARLVSKHRVPVAVVIAYLVMRVLLAVFARV